jgi:chromosome partitioning protein
MIISIVNQKGGVGKTTTAVTLASGLARLGIKTLLVDLDAQGNVSDALGIRKQPGLYRLLVARMDWRDCIIASGVAERRYLHVLPGDRHTVEAKQHLVGLPFREWALQKALGPILGDYQHVVLDLAPSVDVLHIAALVASDAFLVPTRLDHLAVVGVNDALLTVQALDHEDLTPPALLGILPTFWDRTTNESEHQLEYLARTFGRDLWPPIPLDVKAREAPAHGETLWEYARDCRALNGVALDGQMIGGYVAALERLS